jgi:hypothetical protein
VIPKRSKKRYITAGFEDRYLSTFFWQPKHEGFRLRVLAEHLIESKPS